MDCLLQSLFWISAGILFYTFLGYALLVSTIASFHLRRESAARPSLEDSAERVTVILVIRNEEQRIRQRLLNLLDTDYPSNLLELIVVSDGSTDNPESQIGALPARLIKFHEHRGKPACLNDGVDAANGDIIVFADARQSFQKQTIHSLVRAFEDPDVGAASGELFVSSSETGVASGVDLYWRLEKVIRSGESQIDSAIGCTGAVYAIRRSAFDPLPPDTILDDVVCPMQIALKGFRVRFCPDAVALDPQKLDPRTENRRKRRTLAGNFQMLFRYPMWLLPWKNRLFIQVISHKYLRLVAPLLLVLLFFSSIVLASLGSTFFALAGAGQAAFYLLAAIGLCIPSARSKALSIPAAFTFLNFMTVLGFIDFFRRKNRVGW